MDFLLIDLVILRFLQSTQRLPRTQNISLYLVSFRSLREPNCARSTDMLKNQSLSTLGVGGLDNAIF